MIDAVRDFWNRFLGRGDATIAVPSFDGALKPNQKLEQAETLFECAAPEDLATDGRLVFLADGPRLLKLDGPSAIETRVFDKPISALALMPNGGLAVALAAMRFAFTASLRAPNRGPSLRPASMRSTRSRRRRTGG